MGIASIFIRTAQYLLGYEKVSGTNTLLSNTTVLQGTGTNILGADVYTAIPATNGAGLGVWLIGGNPIGLASGTNAIGSVTVSNFPATQPVSGPLTDTQLRASAILAYPGTNQIILAGGTNAVGTVSVTAFPANYASYDAGASPRLLPFVRGLLQSWTGWDLDSIGGMGATGINGQRALGVGALMYNGSTFDAIRGDAANGQDVDVTRLNASTTGGTTPYQYISAANTNAANVKASAGQIYGIFACNTGTANAFLKLYDKATAPVAGTDVPKLTFLVPLPSNGGTISLSTPPGISFANGIGHCITAASGTNDTGIIAASSVVVDLMYK